MTLDQIIEKIKGIPIPDVIKYNIITAFSKGLGKITTAALDIPIGNLEGKAQIIRATNTAKVSQIQAASEAAAKLFATDSDLANRALNKFARDIVESQVNRENVAAKVMENLNQRDFTNSTDEKIDDDWLTQFWNLSSTKSTEQVQEILAKILTKEITKPHSVSPNTLMLLSVLTSDIGIIFQKLSNLSIDTGEHCFVITPKVHAFVNSPRIEGFGISHGDLFELDSMKIIVGAQASQFTYAVEPKGFYKIDYAGINVEADFRGLTMHQIQFTRSGRELRNLMDLKENKLYTEALIEKFKGAFKVMGQ